MVGFFKLLRIKQQLKGNNVLDCSNIQSIENEGTTESSSLPNLDLTGTCTQESSSNASCMFSLACKRKSFNAFTTFELNPHEKDILS